MLQKDIVKDVNTAKLLHFPIKIDKLMEPHWKAWFHFHKAYGHDTEQCVTLSKQIDALIKQGLLEIFKARDVGHREKDGLEAGKEVRSPGGYLQGEKGGHEQATMGELHIIVEGFPDGGVSSVNHKRYARATMCLSESQEKVSSLNFTEEDSRDVFPHDNDPVVISIIMRSRKVFKLLLDQGSLADVLFWDAFVGLGIPIEELEQFDGV